MCNHAFLPPFSPQQGHIEYFGVEEWRSCVRLKHTCAIRCVHCDIGGARAAVVDAKRRAHVYAPANDDLCAVPRNQPNEVK